MVYSQKNAITQLVCFCKKTLLARDIDHPDELCYQTTVNEIFCMHIFDNKDVFDKNKKQLKLKGA